MITKKEKQIAKKKSLLVWDYLRKHPEIRSKSELPINLLKLLENEIVYCPLCTLFISLRTNCPNCPLINCSKNSSPYIKWKIATDDFSTKKAATTIYNKIKNWRIK